MNRELNPPRFHHRLHLYILRRLVILANIIGLSTYLFLRIIFYDLPFVLQEELLITLKIIGWSTVTAVAISFALFAGHGLTHFIRHRRQFGFPTIMQVPEPMANKNSGA